MKSVIMSIFLFMSAVASAIEFSLVGVSTDPYLMWMYAGVGITSFVAGCVFWVVFRDLDAEEDALNTIGVTKREGFKDEQLLPTILFPIQPYLEQTFPHNNMSDITSQDGDDLWGLPLEDHLKSLRRSPTSEEQADPPAPSRAQVEAALKKVYARSPSVSCSTFQDILGIAAYPEEVIKIADEGNKLSSSCVRLLHDYAQRCNGLFYYQYGYLGLQVLALSLLISYDKYSSPRMETTFDYTGGTFHDLVNYLTTNAARALSFETTVITGLPLNPETKAETDSLAFLMDWRGVDAIAACTVDTVVPRMRSDQAKGSASLLPLATKTGMTDPRRRDSLKQLNQLRDLLGRYCLLATSDRTLCIAYAIWRWMYFILLPFTMRPEHYPTPTDMDEIPLIRDLVIQRFKFPLQETDPFECDPTHAELLSVLLGHLDWYQTGSLDASDEDQIPLVEAMFARLWTEIESDRPFYGIEGRDNVHKLTEVVFRCMLGAVS
ncbi:hypothetical protein FRC06_004759 [Ceratobasidium sp. 370]|nr:hypothetical protein FRC06_004759 [Ceratobasidium sp. 370]